MSQVLEPKDYTGKPIKSGFTVVYPVRQGSAMWLQHMIISHIEVIRAHDPIFKLHGTNRDGKLVKLKHPDRCIIIKEGV